MKQRNDNYARNTITHETVFFADATMPTFEYPENWAFYRLPKGQDALAFRGQLVGINPVPAAEAAN